MFFGDSRGPTTLSLLLAASSLAASSLAAKQHSPLQLAALQLATCSNALRTRTPMSARAERLGAGFILGAPLTRPPVRRASRALEKNGVEGYSKQSTASHHNQTQYEMSLTGI